MSLRGRIKRYAKGELMTLSALLLVFGALSILSAFFFAGERKRSLLFAEYLAEESAFALLDFYRQGITPDTEQLDRITGFAIYDGSGNLVISGGDVPESIDIEDIDGRRSTIEIGEKSISVVKLLGMTPGGMASGSPPGSPRMRSMQRQPVISAAIYVTVSAPEYLSRARGLRIGSALAPFVLMTACAFIGFLLMRNWEYRRKIDSQRHLVHLGEAARTLSHEIKNPLSAIQIQAAILRRLSPDTNANGVRVIEEEVGRLRVLTERIGEFLKNPAGSPEQLDAGEFVCRLVERLPWDAACNVEGICDVSIDKERFRSVVENVVKNAAESARGRDADVMVAVSRGRETVTIIVDDSGDGINPDDTSRVFDPFFTTKDTGTGIGLAISRRFIEEAGGAISLEARPEGGTRATISLPRFVE